MISNDMIWPMNIVYIRIKYIYIYIYVIIWIWYHIPFLKHVFHLFSIFVQHTSRYSLSMASQLPFQAPHPSFLAKSFKKRYNDTQWSICRSVFELVPILFLFWDISFASRWFCKWPSHDDTAFYHSLELDFPWFSHVFPECLPHCISAHSSFKHIQAVAEEFCPNSTRCHYRCVTVFRPRWCSSGLVACCTLRLQRRDVNPWVMSIRYNGSSEVPHPSSAILGLRASH